MEVLRTDGTFDVEILEYTGNGPVHNGVDDEGRITSR